MLFKAVAHVPEEMAKPPGHMMHQGPSVSEQDQPPEPGAEKPVYPFEIGGRCSSRKQPPDKQKCTEIQRTPCDPVKDRHDHGRYRLVDGEMRRKGAVIV